MRIVDTPEPANLDIGPGLGTRAVTAERYRTNVTTLTERIAIRLAGDGAEHPVAAAVTIAVRGMKRVEPGEYARVLGLAPADVRALEAGTVPLADLPASLWCLVHELGLEPLLLVDLDRQLRAM